MGLVVRGALIAGCIAGLVFFVVGTLAVVLDWGPQTPKPALSGDVQLISPTDQPPQNCAVVTAISKDQAIEAVVCLPYPVHTWLIQPAPQTVVAR